MARYKRTDKEKRYDSQVIIYKDHTDEMGEYHMDIKKHGNVTVVHIPVRFDAHSSRDVEHVLQEVIKSGTKKVLCNFSHTDYISSAGLRVLLSASKELKKSDRQLYLCSASSFVQEVLEISGLTTILKIYETEKDALSDIG